MQETLCVLCRGDVNGGDLLWPTTRRGGGRAEAGGLEPGAALTSPRGAGRRLKSLRVGRSAPAREARPCRPAPARWPGGARPRSRQPVRLSTACRVGETCGRSRRPLLPADVAANDALDLRSTRAALPGLRLRAARRLLERREEQT